MISVAQLQVVVGADIAGALGGLGKVNKAVSGAGSFIGGVLSSATGFGLATLGLNAFGNVAGFVNDSIIGLNSTMENQQSAFANLLGSAPAATAFLGQLRTFANQTAFSFTDVAGAAQRFLAVGMKQGAIIPLLTNIAGAATAMGMGTEGVNRLTLALAQMQSKGRVQGDELLQLSEAGIPGLQLLASFLGKTVVQTQALVSAGKVSAQQFLDAFMVWGKSKGLPGIVANSQKTWEGATNTIVDTVKSGLADAFFPLFDLLREGAVNLAAFLQTPAFDAFVARVRAGVASIVQGWGTLAVMIGNIAGAHGLNLLQAALVAIEIRLGQVFGPQTAGTFHNLIDIIQSGGQWLLDNGPKFFDWLLTNAPTAIETGITKLSDLKSWLETQIPPAIETLKGAFATLSADVVRNIGVIQTRLEDMILQFAALPIPGILGGNPLAGAASDIMKRRGLLPSGLAVPLADPANIPGLPGGLFPGGPIFAGPPPGATIHVTVTGNNIDNQVDVDDMARQLAAAVAAGQASAANAPPNTLVGAA
jgi:tape measure domain-containing protein